MQPETDPGQDTLLAACADGRLESAFKSCAEATDKGTMEGGKEQPVGDVEGI